MNRIIVAMALVLLSVSMASAQFPMPGEFAAPPDAELGYTQYPIYPKVLTPAQMARLEVKAISLNTPTVVFNHYRGLNGKDGRFVLETLPAGTVVLVDKKNVIRYKADCGNRLVEFKKPEAVIVTSNGSSSTMSVRTSQRDEPMISWTWNPEGIQCLLLMLGALALLAVVIATVLGIYQLMFGWPERNRAWGGNGGRADTRTHPLAEPVPAAATPAPSRVAQAQVARTPATPARDTERTDGVRSTVYVNQGDATRPHLITWSGHIRSLSFSERPDGSHEIRVDNRR